MKFRIKDLKNYISGEVNWKKVTEELNVKSYETIFDGKVCDIEIMPNRYPDSASLIGLSREISVITKFSQTPPQIKIKESKINLFKFVKVKVQTSKCLNYFGRVMLDVKNQKSPQWLKEFVEFYGFNSVDLLVDLSNFAMIEYGAPAHIFDLDMLRVSSLQSPQSVRSQAKGLSALGGSGELILIIRESKEGEVFQSLSGKKVELPVGSVVIENNGKIIDLVGIQGGELAKITLKTKNILIQAPIVESSSIRAVSKKIDLKTDASHRFERGIPVMNSSLVVDELVNLIQKTAGGKITSGKIELGEMPKPLNIFLHFNKVKEYSGFDLSSKQIEAIFKKIGCKIIKQTNAYLYISPPLWRLDLKIEEDLIEEIIRIEGWDKIKNELPATRTFPKEDETLVLDDLVKKIITASGFDEVLNYSFIGDEDLVNLEKIFNAQEAVRVLNPVSSKYSVFRPVIFLNLIKNVKINTHSNREIRIFETGHCAKFVKNNAKNDKSFSAIIENQKLGFLISLPDTKDMLLEANGLIKLFFDKIGIDAHIKNSHIDIFESSADIHLDGETAIGFVGLLNNELSNFYNLDQRVVVGEFDLGIVLENMRRESAYKPIPEFPSIIRDVSLIVPEISQIDHIESEIQFLGGEMLEGVNLFDVYQPEDMPDKKSIAFRLVFRAKDRSLTDDEINKIMQKIAHSLMDKFGAGIR